MEKYLLPQLRRLTPALLTLLAACGSSRPITLGLAGAFDDPVGRPMKLGAELAIEEINAAGGVNGRPLQLIERNDYGNTDSAVVAASALYQSDAVAVIGHLFSGTTLAAAPVYNGGSNPIAAISPSSSAPEVSQAGPWIFRVCPSDEQHGLALARWIRERLGLSRGTVLYLNDDYGRGVRQRFVAEFTRRGGEVLAQAPYLGAIPDVGAYLDRLERQGGSQFIVDAGNRSEAETILRELHARGLNLPLLGADGLEGIEQSGDLAEGVYETLAYLPQLETAANQRFVAAYRAKYPTEPLPNQPAAASYDAIHVLAQVMAKAGTNRRKVRDALYDVNIQHPYDGVTGRIAFDSLGDVPTREVYVAVVRNGALRLAGGQ
jgi:branched-chain amino acid transport system substrate-binding protein